jgi:cell division transport system permease protein
VRFITREEACETFEKKYEGKYALGDLDPEILRDRFAIKVIDLGRMEETREAVKKVTGIADARADENLAEGFITLRNVAGVVCIALIAILLVVSVFIISNTIKLTTFDRRDEIAIMKMVGATNGFIRWPFVYEGFIIGLLSAGVAFGLQWLLYATVARSISVSDALNLFSVVDFATIWKPVALVFVGVGMLVGVGGSLTAIRKFLQV